MSRTKVPENKLTPKERQTLVNDNLKFAYWAASRLIAKHHQLAQHRDDLRQAAVVGLCEAAKRFDPNRGSKFLSYARPWVELRIREESHHLGCVLYRNQGEWSTPILLELDAPLENPEGGEDFWSGNRELPAEAPPMDAFDKVYATELFREADAHLRSHGNKGRDLGADIWRAVVVEDKTLASQGVKYGFSRERARQLFVLAEAKLNDFAREQLAEAA